jgi:hypothetical protein
MQVSATLIAAQQAAREAQARFQQTHAPILQAGFASALTEAGKMAETGKTDSFSALPLKQTAPQAATPSAPAPQGTAARLGTHLDITV